MQISNEITVCRNVARHVGVLQAFMYGIMEEVSAELADNKGWFQITLRELSEITGLTSQTIIKNTRELEEYGLLKIQGNSTRGGNFYRVLRPRFKE